MGKPKGEGKREARTTYGIPEGEGARGAQGELVWRGGAQYGRWRRVGEAGKGWCYASTCGRRVGVA